jgi:hypothetical protein
VLRYLQAEVSPLPAIMYKADSKELGSDIVCGRRQSVLQQIVVTTMSVDLFNFWKEVVSKTAAVAGCESTCIKINPLNCNLQGSMIMFVNCIFFIFLFMLWNCFYGRNFDIANICFSNLVFSFN